MTITRFEDIDAWQMARKLCQDIHGICYETVLQKDFGLRDQMSRSSGSIMDNIEQAFERLYDTTGKTHGKIGGFSNTYRQPPVRLPAYALVKPDN